MRLIYFFFSFSLHFLQRRFPFLFFAFIRLPPLVFILDISCFPPCVFSSLLAFFPLHRASLVHLHFSLLLVPCLVFPIAAAFVFFFFLHFPPPFFPYSYARVFSARPLIMHQSSGCSELILKCLFSRWRPKYEPSFESCFKNLPWTCRQLWALLVRAASFSVAGKSEVRKDFFCVC